jgi:hypothetical protein
MDVDETQTAPETTENAPTKPDNRTAGLEAGIAAERRKRQEVESRLAEIEAANAERDRKQAEEQGEYQRLYQESLAALEAVRGELEPTKAAHAELVDLVEADLTKRLEALPEDKRPPLDGLPLARRRELLAWAESAVGKPDEFGGTRAVGGSRKPPIPRACKDYAVSVGKDPQFVYDTLWQRPGFASVRKQWGAKE